MCLTPTILLSLISVTISMDINVLFNSSLYISPHWLSSIYRSQGLQEVEVPRNFRQSTHQGDTLVWPMDRPPFPQGSFLVLISVSLSPPQGHSATGRTKSRMFL
jgi:hypothetical protein